MAVMAPRERLRRSAQTFEFTSWWASAKTGKPVTAGDLGGFRGHDARCSIEAILPKPGADATEGTPAMVHTGPFGNIAHGTQHASSPI